MILPKPALLEFFKDVDFHVLVLFRVETELRDEEGSVLDGVVVTQFS